MRRVLELGSGITYLAFVVILGIRAHNVGALDLPGLPPMTPGKATVILAIVAVAVLVMMRWRIRQHSRPPFLTVPLILPIALGLLVAIRGVYVARADFLSTASGNTAGIYTRSMNEIEAHAFALRLMAAALSDPSDSMPSKASLTPPSIPDEWPLPDGFRFALTRSEGILTIWSRRGEETCRILLPSAWWMAEPNSGFSCDETGPAPETWEPPIRGAANFHDETEPLRGTSWPQYRRTASRDGSSAKLTDGRKAPEWVTRMGGSARASVSVSNSRVLIGAHGTGSLGAYDLETGELLWQVREPNWIHQDAVSEGRRAYVGFGDNGPSLRGVAPGGVTAHDLASGRRVWTRFLDNSVMTAPAIHDSIVIFGTAKGDMWGVHNQTGNTIWEARVPGNLIMAPPLLVGDTVVVSLDPRGLCALSANGGLRYWCISLPGRMNAMGHISPTASNGMVYGSATVDPKDLFAVIYVEGLAAVPRVWRWLIHGASLEVAHQDVYAVRLRDGVVQWTAELDSAGDCCSRRTQRGHMSGTPVIVPGDSSLVVVSPFSDRVYRLDEDTGAILARSEPIPTFPRGPALVVDSTVIAVDRQGVIHVLAVDDLHERCALPLGEAVDRAGPTLAGGALLIAGRDGGLYSIPLDDVLRCDPTLSSRIARLRVASATGS